MSKASKRLRRQAVSATKSRVAELSVLALGAAFLAPYAIAQDQAGATKDAGEQSTTKSDDDLTEIMVTGIRKALATSAEIKREADTVVDSITATDIGAFPDKSVAEALQRMTGITVTRFAASGDTTHFSAEPSGVVIRGLPQVRSEFNGRDSFNANSSRGLSFGDVSPELMAGVDTYKNATADMIEGGIAGTVNLRTHVPFNSQGMVAAFSGEVGYGDLSKDAKPSGSVLFSNRWDTGSGDWGIMANVAYSDVTTESQGTQILRFFNNQGIAAYGGGQKWVPGGVDIRSNTYYRTRKGASLAAQWQSPDDSLLATLQYNRSEYNNDWEEYSLSAGIGDSQTAQNLVVTSPTSVAAVGTPAYEFDSQGVFMRGVINQDSGAWVGSDTPLLAHPGGYDVTGSGSYLQWYCHSWNGAGSGPACPATRGVGLSADTRHSEQENITQDLSLNLRWDVNERLGLKFDIQKIDSEVNNFDNSANSKTATDLYLDLTGNKPYFEFRNPTGFANTAGGFSDPANYYPEWAMEHTEASTGEELAMRLDADIDLGSEGWLDSLRVGVRRAEREQNINWSRYNWGAVQPLWGIQAGQPVFMNQGPWANLGVAKDLGSDLVGGGVFGGGTFIHPDYGVISSYANTISQYQGRSNSWIPLQARTNCPGKDPNSLYCPVEMQSVTEDSDAAYIMLKFGNDDTNWGNVNVRGNIGVRWVTTEVGAVGGVQFPVYEAPEEEPDPSQPLPPIYVIPADDIAFANEATFAQSGGGKHTNWLPSLNLRFGVTEEQFVRMSVSRALTRPDMGLYKNYIGISRVQPTCGDGSVTYAGPNCTGNAVSYRPQYSASAGNPGLGPTTADQLDFTYEYYFSNTGSFTAAVFMKQFNDYVQYGNYLRSFTNNGVTRDVSVRGPVTGDGAKLRGFEVAYQTFFERLPAPWNGLGMQANFTYVDNQGITNSNLSTVSNDGQTQQDPLITFTDLPLEGYSKSSYNVVLMYEQPKYSGRLAWNWRSDYLISQSDCCIKLPIWQDAYGQLDASVHYKPSSNWDIFLDAQNLLQAETVLRQQVTANGLLLPRSWFMNDRRLQLGVRYRIQ